MTMNPTLLSWSALAVAIVCEVTGTAFLQRSERFIRLVPSLMTANIFLQPRDCAPRH